MNPAEPRVLPRPSAGRPGAAALGVVLGLASLGPGWRADAHPAAAPVPLVIELRWPEGGSTWVVPPRPTLHAALAEVGLPPRGPDRELLPGEAVRIGPGGPAVGPVSNPLPLGLRVNPNHADAAALEALPGIGPSLAQAILKDRAARGPFRKLQDLDRVRGIGPATLRRLSPYLEFDEVPDGG